MQKWISDRCVCAPQYRSAGTSIFPMESVSRRGPDASMPIWIVTMSGPSLVFIAVASVVLGQRHGVGDGFSALPEGQRGTAVDGGRCWCGGGGGGGRGSRVPFFLWG